ncbi:MAG: TolC family protein [Gemmatimonadaceae bacterium]
MRLLAVWSPVVVSIVLSTATAGAQGRVVRPTMPLSRTAAAEVALVRSPQSALAAADTASAAASVLLARQWENPTATISATKSDPQRHYTLDWALDPSWIRSPRIAAAQASRDAARLRAAFVRAAIAFDVDTAYTRVQLAAARSQLSARSARDADSLLTLARVRRDAGDASTLDVELAGVFAGQSHNTASMDSMAVLTARLTLLTLMGVPSDSVELRLTDSLSLATVPAVTTVATSTAASAANASRLLVAAAGRDVDAASARVNAERAKRFGTPSVQVGMEAMSPGGPVGAMAVAGVSIPLPVLNRNEASVALARADLTRAEALRAATAYGSAATVVAAEREAAATRARAERSASLVAAADRIASLSLLAYREGASPLATVLDAQRSARETLAQFYDDIAAAYTAVGLLRLVITSTSDTHP